MQVFEFHFNPEVKEDTISESFCYIPENIYEKRLGSIYIVGELENVLPQNLKLLPNLFQVIKEKYYALSFKTSEKALFESLKAVNEFLSSQVKKENVSWLGNLSLGIISINPATAFGQGRWNINFTKVGDLKILLYRGGQIIEISKNLEFSEIEPYPLKVFSNIVSGKLAEGDKILILTKEVFSAFSSENFLTKIAEIQVLNKKEINKILKSKQENFSKISGICLLVILSKEAKPLETITLQKKTEKFSLARVFKPIFEILKKIKIPKIRFKVKIPKICFPKISFPKIILPSIKFKVPAFKKPSFKKISLPSNSEGGRRKSIFFALRNKNLILILSLFIFLLMGFFLFKGEKEEALRTAREVLKGVESKKTQAENFLIFKKEGEANVLLQEAWNEILPQTKARAPLKEEAISLKKSLEEILFSLNKIEEVKEPQLLFEFESEKLNLIPQRILSLNSDLFFYNPFSKNVYKFEIAKKTGQILSANQNLISGTISKSYPLFFSRPDILISLSDGNFKTATLEKPYPDFNFGQLVAFKSYLYFLDVQSGEIARYSLLNFEENKPLTGKLWLVSQTKKAISAKSMAIDGSIWILTKNNEIDRYYGGIYKETLKINLFPYLENPTKILTLQNSPYLYLLEPVEKRLVILTKDGEISRQFQSEKFDNLLDFTISQDGKTIYLLNGLKIYQIEITSVPL